MSCSMGECGRKHKARGLCQYHYDVVRKGRVAPAAPTGITYSSAHRRVRETRGSAASHSCVRCGGAAREWAYDRLDADEKIEVNGSDAGMLFSLDPNHYLPMCKPCHARFDLRHVA